MAAKQGCASAQHSLGRMYKHGQGVAAGPDYAKAKEWIEKAAKRGVAGAQFDLGELHELAQGVEQSDLVAMLWYEKAAAQGVAQAEVRTKAILAKQATERRRACCCIS